MKNKKKSLVKMADMKSVNLDNLSDVELEALNTLVISDGVYDSVLDKLDIDQEDEMYRALIKGMLKRQVKDYLIFEIWNSLSDPQLRHLRDFMNQMSVAAPFMELDDVMMEFAMLYPDLVGGLHIGLDKFFRRFVEQFEKIGEK